MPIPHRSVEGRKMVIPTSKTVNRMFPRDNTISETAERLHVICTSSYVIRGAGSSSLSQLLDHPMIRIRRDTKIQVISPVDAP